ncbi:Muniscin C-terminal mu homology domain-containing protein [Gaertneriomyces semiglobifer]|nr:Muniscin C-terminal mu homology domain-containing protein [Gaertneriomyces semiglobifer]
MTSYVDAFSFDKPKESLEILLKRLKRGVTLDEEVANYFRDRALIEERYANELARLTKKSSINNEGDFVGSFTDVWDQVLDAASQTSAAHMTFAKELSLNLEKTLRTRVQTDPDWSKLKQYESEFGKATREYDDRVIKHLKAVTKSQRKGGSEKLDKKSAEALAAREVAKETWLPLAIETFQKFQAMDESRLNNLKETMSRFAELDSKHGATRAAISDGVLASAMNFDVAGDINAFCVQKTNMQPGSSNQYSLPDVSSSAATSRKPSVVAERASVAGSIAPHQGSASAAPAQPLVDAEGYSIPPPVPTPWAETDHAALDAADQDMNSLNGAPKLKVAIRDEAIVESPEEALNALRQFQLPTNGPSRPSKRNTRRLSMTENIKATEVSDNQRKRMTMQNAADYGAFNFANMPPMPPLPALEASAVTSSSKFPIAPPSPLQLQFSISETLNVLLKANAIDKVLLAGVVSLTATKEAFDMTPRDPIIVTLSDHGQLAQMVPNEAFARVVDSTRPNEFQVNLDAVSSSGLPSVPIIKYQVHIGNPAEFVPLYVNPVWKCEPTQTSLLLMYQFNSILRQRISLADVSFLVQMSGGGNIGQVQMKPHGHWNSERRAILWKIGTVSSDTHAAEPQKLLARVESTEECQPGAIIVRFNNANSLLSDVNVQVTGDSLGKGEIVVKEIVKSVTAGTYGASS